MAAMRTMGLAPVFPPNARVDESKGKYVVRLPVPGFAREEIELEIADRVVSLCGDQTQNGVETRRPFCLHERLEERFSLPDDVDAANVTASYSHGEIELQAPRTNGSSSAPRKVPINQRFAVNADASGV
jgi:HSP20 family protein